MKKPKAEKMISTKIGIPNALISGNPDHTGHQMLEIYAKESDEELFKVFIKAMTGDVQE